MQTEMKGDRDKSNNSKFKSSQEQQTRQNISINLTTQMIDNLMREVEKLAFSLPNQLEDEVQQELSKLLAILRRVKTLEAKEVFHKRKTLQAELVGLIINIKIAIQSIKSNSNKLLIKKLRQDTELALRRLENPLLACFVNSYQNFLYWSNIPTKIIVGLFLALPLYFLVPSRLHASLVSASDYLAQVGIIQDSPQERETNLPTIYKQDFLDHSNLIILSLISGATGSIISILTRIDEYKDGDYNQKYEDSILPICIGLFKPIIGGSFGILIFTLLGSQVLPISLAHTNSEGKRQDLRWLSFISITFIAGFSERLVKDIVSDTEKRFKSANGSGSESQKLVEFEQEKQALAKTTFEHKSTLIEARSLNSSTLETFSDAPQETIESFPANLDEEAYQTETINSEEELHDS
jgi:hypothetical protein